MIQKLNKYGTYSALIIGLMFSVSFSAASSENNPGRPTKEIAGIYQGFIKTFDEPITLRLEQGGNAQYITTPELHRETTALGSWKLLSRKGQVDTLELVTIVYIRDDFCDMLIDDIDLNEIEIDHDCIIYGGGEVTVTTAGYLSGSYDFSIASARDPEVIIFNLPATLELNRLPTSRILELATTSAPP